MVRNLVVIVFGLLASSAFAQKPRLVVVPFSTGEGASDRSATKFSALVSDELKGRADAVEVVAPPVTRPAPEKPSAARRGPSQETLTNLENGRKAFDDLRFDEAIPALKKGLELMLADPATADFEVVQDALVKVAAANFRTGEEKEAKTALLDLARLSPGYALPAGYPPVFQREFEKAQKRLDKQPRGQIVVEGPSGATAFIDGRDLGMVPVTEENVAAGLHYVKVEGARGERFGQTLDVKGSTVKVKASFGAPPERTPVNMVPNPNVTATVDDGMAQRLVAYCKAAGADYALIGIVSRVSDTQLSAGTSLFHAKRGAFAVLTPVTFDVDVLTANTESFKLADEVLKRTASLGSTETPPFALLAKKTQTVVAVKPEPTKTNDGNGDELSVVGPERRVKPTPVLRPKDRVLDRPANVVDDPVEEPPPPPAEVKAGVPVWVWIVGGIAVAGAGVGAGFGIAHAVKPVTGTVTASW